MKTLLTFDDVLSLWDRPKSLSEDLGVPYINAQAMKNRGSIGIAHWPRLIEVLTAKGYSVTSDDLAKMWAHARERRAVAKQEGAAA